MKKNRIAALAGLVGLLVAVPALAWQQVSSALATDVGAGGNGGVWITGTNAVGGGFDIYRINQPGNGLMLIPGGATEVAVDPSGNPWIINSAHAIYRRVGNDWQQLPGEARDIGIGADGTAWIIGNTPTAGGFGIFRWSGSAWTAIDGGGVRIAVDAQGNPWVVNDAHGIFRRVGNAWQLVPGAANDIGIGGSRSAVWIIGTNAVAGGFGIHQWNGRSWDPRPGGGVRISVDSTGNPWIVNSSHAVFGP